MLGALLSRLYRRSIGLDVIVLNVCVADMHSARLALSRFSLDVTAF